MTKQDELAELVSQMTAKDVQVMINAIYLIYTEDVREWTPELVKRIKEMRPIALEEIDEAIRQAEMKDSAEKPE